MLDDHLRPPGNLGRRPRDLDGPGTDGAPFTVRQPLWNWGFGTQLVNGDGSAITYIILGVLFDGFAVLILFALYHAVRQWRRHRQQAGSCLEMG